MSILSRVYQKQTYFQWQIEWVCPLTMLCRIHQFMPNTSFFKTIYEQTSAISRADSSSSFFEWWSSKIRIGNFIELLGLLFCQFTISSMHFWACRSMSWDNSPDRNSWFEHPPPINQECFVWLVFTLSICQKPRDQEMTLMSYTNEHWSPISSTRNSYSLSCSAVFLSSTYIDKKIFLWIENIS